MKGRNKVDRKIPSSRRASDSGLALLIPVAILAVGCGKPGESPPTTTAAPPDSVETAGRTTPQPPPADSRLFTEITEQLVGRGEKEIWPDGKYFTPEISPGGVALFDYDNDGDLDIYQVCHAPAGDMPDPFDGAAPNRLFRQEAGGQFVEVPDAAGLADPGFGHGVAIGDIDNDGDLDVFVTNYGPNSLYVNESGPKGPVFRNATEAADIFGDHWSSSAAFFDYDRDGYLDLYVVNFAVFDPHERCGPDSDFKNQDFCGPHVFPGTTDTLYRNNADGTFANVTEQVGIDAPARGWGVVAIDLTGDDLPDIYVANDEEPNQLWVNQGDNTFVDEGLLRGVALNGAGDVEASMGVALGDVNGDALLDLFMTHITLQSNTLYTAIKRNSTADPIFADASSQAGLPAVDRPYTGWGCAFLDLDHDGDLDLAVANGRVAKGAPRPTATLSEFWSRYVEPNLLFENDGSGRFRNTSSNGGKFASRLEMTRGLATGDLDGDGDLDMVTNSVDNTLRIFRNDAPHPGTHWLLVRALVGQRDAIGAKLTLHLADGERVGIILPSTSYLSSSDPRAHFGIGADDHVESLDVTWPDGTQQRYSVPGVDRQITVRQEGG